MTSNTPLTDIELLKRVANSDSKALEILYNRYSPLLYTTIKKIVSDEEIAQQVLADVFVIVWRKIRCFDFDSNNPYTWLVILTRNSKFGIELEAVAIEMELIYRSIMMYLKMNLSSLAYQIKQAV